MIFHRKTLFSLLFNLVLIILLTGAGMLTASAQQTTSGVSVIHLHGEYIVRAQGPGGYVLHIDEKQGIPLNVTDAAGCQRYTRLDAEQGGLAGIPLQVEARAFLYLVVREDNAWKMLFGAAPTPPVTVRSANTADGIRVDAVHPGGVILSYFCAADGVKVSVSGLPEGREARLGFQFAAEWQPIALGVDGAWQWPTAWNGGFAPSPHEIAGQQFDLLFGAFAQDIALTLPARASIRWQYTRPVFWRIGPAIYGTLPVQNDQPVTLAFPPSRPLPDNLSFALCAYRGGDPTGQAQVQATLPLHVKAGEAVTLRLSPSVNAALPNGQLLAFYSTAVADAMQAQIAISYNRLDNSALSWRPLPLQVVSDTQVAFTLPADLPPGPLALRLLVAEPDMAAQLRTGRLLTVFPERRWDLPYGRQRGLRGDAIIAVTRGAAAPATTLTASFPAFRSTYLQGEVVEITLRSTAPLKSSITVHWEQAGGISGSKQLPAGTRRVLLDTAGLPIGDYRVTISAEPQNTATADFTLTGATPGAPFIKAHIGSTADALSASRFGINVWMDVMYNSSGLERYYPGNDAFPLSPWLRKLGVAVPVSDGEDIFDRLLGAGMRYFSGSHNRYASFSFAHTLPLLTDTARRKRLLVEQELRDNPANAGHLLDFDALGLFSGNYGDDNQQANSIIADIRKSLETRFADWWVKQPESQLPPDSAEGKQAKAGGWVRFLSTVMEAEYAAEMADFRRVDPTMRHTTSLTADHSPFSQGEWLPGAYRPLDLRYITVWSDQVYGYSHWDLQHLLWQDTVRAAGTAAPQWTTAPILPETDVTQHMRLALELYGRGAQGVGIADEAPTLDTRAASGSPMEQAANLTGKLVQQFGPLFRQVSYRPQVAILYSEGQGVSNWSNWAYGTPLTTLYNVLALNNVPASFITERSIASGGLKAYRALVVTSQTMPLPAPVMTALQTWQQAGGAIYADEATTIALPGVKPLGFKLESMPYYERSTVIGNRFYEYAAKNRQAIRTALGAYDGLPVVEDPRALLTMLSGGEATYLVAANNARFAWDPMLPEETLYSNWYIQMIKPGWALYSRDARQPIQLALPFAGAKPAVIYPLLGRAAAVQNDQLNLDFRSLPGEIFCLLPRPIGPAAVRAQSLRGATEIAIAARGADGQPLAAAIPVRVTLNGADVYLATDASGHAVARIPHRTPPAVLTVTELLSGKSATIPVARAAEAAAAPVSAGAAVTVFDRENIRNFLRKKEPVVILLDPAQQGLRNAAGRLAQMLTRLGRPATVTDQAAYVSLPLAWELTEEQQAAITRVKAGEVLGWRTRASREWYDLALPHTTLYRDAILLGNPTTNHFIADLQTLRLLPRRLTADYPEPGAAVLEFAASPFAYGYDVLVIGGTSDASVRTGIDALARHVAGSKPLPDDLITRRVQQAREDYLQAIGMPSSHQLDFQATWARLGSPKTTSTVTPLPRLVDQYGIRPGVTAVSANGAHAAMAANRLGSNLTAFDPKTGAIRWIRAAALAYPTWLEVGDDGTVLAGDGYLATYFAPDGTGKFRIQARRAYLIDGQVWVPQDDSVRQLDETGKEIRRLSVLDPTPGGTKQAPWTLAVGAQAKRITAAYTATEHKDWRFVVSDFNGKIIWQTTGIWEPLPAFAPDGSLVVAEHGQWADRSDLDGAGTLYTRIRWFSPTGTVEAERLINQRATDLTLQPDGKSAVLHVPGWPALIFERATGLLTAQEQTAAGARPTPAALEQALLAQPFADAVKAFGAIPLVLSPDMVLPRPPGTVELAKFRWFGSNYSYLGQPLAVNFPMADRQYDFTITTSGVSPTTGEFTIYAEGAKGRTLIGKATAHSADGRQWTGRLTAPGTGPQRLIIFYNVDDRRIRLDQLILREVE